MKIQTIQIRVVATFVPPGAFIFHGTVTTVAVIITIFGAKWISSVIRKGISSGTLKKRSDNNNTVNYIVLVFHELLARCLIKRFAVQAKKSSVQYDLDNSYYEV